MARFLLCGKRQLEKLTTLRPGYLPESGWNRNETVQFIQNMVYTRIWFIKEADKAMGRNLARKSMAAKEERWLTTNLKPQKLKGTVEHLHFDPPDYVAAQKQTRRTYMG